MSYFSSKSTWLSLVDAAHPVGEDSPKSETAPVLDGLALSFEDYRPCFPAEGGSGFGGSDASDPEGKVKDTAEDLDYLRITMELRHRMFFHFKEWEFGPALLEDHLRLAQAQTDAEEALVHYCQARHVAVTLVEKFDQPTYRLAWIEADRVIAEIHALIGNTESCALYAKEGLNAIKQGRFTADYDMRITKLAVRFLNLLEGK
ncbi:MAG: hypothetical protein JWP91_3386 [Fibrobacteres bacterium]|nr:hypothetical protein [Fibrobacterota bacterium]